MPKQYMSDAINLAGNLGLRLEQPNDKSFIAALLREVRPELEQISPDKDAVDYVYQQQFEARSWGYGVQFPDAWHMIIEQSGDPIGLLVLDINEQRARVVDVAVIPQMQGQGVGEKVFAGVQQTAEQMALPLSLCTRRDNLSALQFYKRLGFQAEPDTGSLQIELLWLPPVLRR